MGKTKIKNSRLKFNKKCVSALDKVFVNKEKCSNKTLLMKEHAENFKMQFRELEKPSKRYVVSNEGMKKGYWKIIDTKTGYVKSSGITSKKGAIKAAEYLNETS